MSITGYPRLFEMLKALQSGHSGFSNRDFTEIFNRFACDDHVCFGFLAPVVSGAVNPANLEACCSTP
jgi:hypothetical protein